MTEKEGMKADLRWFNRRRREHGLPPYTMADLARFQQKFRESIAKLSAVKFGEEPSTRIRRRKVATVSKP